MNLTLELQVNLKSKIENDVLGRGNGISKDLEVKCQAVGVEGMRWERSKWQEPEGGGPFEPHRVIVMEGAGRVEGAGLVSETPGSLGRF